MSRRYKWQQTLPHHKKLKQEPAEIAGENLKDVILGGQDGLVNVLGIVLGLAGAGISTNIIVIAGLVATAAESISMAAVAYTSTQAQREFYESERAREYREVEEVPSEERQEVKMILQGMGFTGSFLNKGVSAITKDKDRWVDFMMREELRLFPEDYGTPLKSAIVVGGSAVVGSLIPLVAFFFTDTPIIGAALGLVISAIALFLLGAIKAKITIGNWFGAGMQLMMIGILAALAGFAVGYLFNMGSLEFPAAVI
jgi:VIT1/CCC1 family predicted Fe2+/Mn2+ transporter